MKIKIGKLHIEINASVSWNKPYMKKVIQAIRKDKFLEAVKIYKNATGKNLKESKEDIRLIMIIKPTPLNGWGMVISVGLERIKHNGWQYEKLALQSL